MVNRLCILAIALIGLTGCYEQEVQIKQWAETKSYDYFRNLVVLDAQSRSSKIAIELITHINSVGPKLERLAKQIAIPNPKKINGTPSLEDYVTHYRFYRDLFLDYFDDFIAIDSELKSLNEQLTVNSQHCDDYFKNSALPLIDAGALSALSGRSGFEFYLSLSSNFGAGSSSSMPSIDFSQNRNFVEQFVDTVINKPIGDLFSSKEEKEALDRAKKTLTQNMPNEEERRAIAIRECRNILSPVFSPTAKQKYLIMRLREAAHQSINALQENATRSFVDLKKSYELQKQHYLAEIERDRIENDMFYRRSDILKKYCNQVDRAMLPLISAIYQNDCLTMIKHLTDAKKAHSEMGKFLIDNDLFIFQTKYQQFATQIHKYESKVLTKRCGAEGSEE